jgi:hypothetical protein
MVIKMTSQISHRFLSTYHISQCDRATSRFFYALEKVKPENPQEVAGLSLMLITSIFSSMAGVTVGLGYLGYKLYTNKTISKIEDWPHPVKPIPVGSLIRNIGESYGKAEASYRGIIIDQGEGWGQSVVCYERVSYHINVSISLYDTVEQLKGHGYEVVETPKEDDVILYFDSKNNIDKKTFNHVGIVEAIDDGIVWVNSKWGKTHNYLHLEEAVPKCYGDGVVYLRKTN